MRRLLKIIIPIIFVFVYFLGCAREDLLKKYEYLQEPKISTMPKQKMLVVEVQGDPNLTGKDAFSSLIRMFYKIKRKSKDLKMSAPRARWPKPADTPKNEWMGIYALPVPDSIENLPEQKKGSPEVKIDYWEYGEVAEILHIGPFSKEEPAIEKLYKFIEDSGYEIAGPHEEEYVKGPGMFFRGNENKYLTIIRYNVRKKI